MSAGLPKRSTRYGVGKDIGGAVYVHRAYQSRLGHVVGRAVRRLPADFPYTIVKYNYRTRAVSFVVCDDFLTAPEPTVGDIITVLADGQLRQRRQPQSPEIYHHKWLFVADGFTGFDVEQSKRRSSAWIGLDEIDRKRIGRKAYWEAEVVPRLPEA